MFRCREDTWSDLVRRHVEWSQEGVLHYIQNKLLVCFYVNKCSDNKLDCYIDFRCTPDASLTALCARFATKVVESTC